MIDFEIPNFVFARCGERRRTQQHIAVCVLDKARRTLFGKAVNTLVEQTLKYSGGVFSRQNSLPLLRRSTKQTEDNGNRQGRGELRRRD
jgi:hypothetical protein